MLLPTDFRKKPFETCSRAIWPIVRVPRYPLFVIIADWLFKTSETESIHRESWLEVEGKYEKGISTRCKSTSANELQCIHANLTNNLLLKLARKVIEAEVGHGSHFLHEDASRMVRKVVCKGEAACDALLDAFVACVKRVLTSANVLKRWV